MDQDFPPNLNSKRLRCEGIRESFTRPRWYCIQPLHFTFSSGSSSSFANHRLLFSSLLGTSCDGKTLLNLCVAPWLLISFNLTWSKNSKQRSRGIRTFNHVSSIQLLHPQDSAGNDSLRWGQKSELLDLNEAVRNCYCKLKITNTLDDTSTSSKIYWI